MTYGCNVDRLCENAQCQEVEVGGDFGSRHCQLYYHSFHAGTDSDLPSGKAPCHQFSSCGHCAIQKPYAVQHSAASMPLQLAAPTVFTVT